MSISETSLPPKKMLSSCIFAFCGEKLRNIPAKLNLTFFLKNFYKLGSRSNLIKCKIILIYPDLSGSSGSLCSTSVILVKLSFCAAIGTRQVLILHGVEEVVLQSDFLCPKGHKSLCKNFGFWSLGGYVLLLMNNMSVSIKCQNDISFRMVGWIIPSNIVTR